MKYRKTDIQNAVNVGKTVTVPKTNVTIDTWTGVGYILLDPNTGAGAYMISGGFAGGGADVNLAEIGKGLLIIFTLLGIVVMFETIEVLVMALTFVLVESLIAALIVIPIILFAYVVILIAIALLFVYVILPRLSNNYNRTQKNYIAYKIL